MIEISRTENSITILGHAEFAELGKDIVCAGISALVQTLIQSIEELTADAIQYDMQPGSVKITFDNPSNDAQLLIASFWIGVEMIAETYPYNVSIEK